MAVKKILSGGNGKSLLPKVSIVRKEWNFWGIIPDTMVRRGKREFRTSTHVKQ